MTSVPPDGRQYVPLTCHGHSRPVPHIGFSSLARDENYYLISACKDGNPILRDGRTGDWIGTFIGHKGAVWQAKLSHDISTAATASADFTASLSKIWDTHTGELLYTLQHNHIVRAIAYPPHNADMIATGGFEKKLRIFDLAETRPRPSSPSASAPIESVTLETGAAFEIGAGVHKDSIKFIVWTNKPTILITASGNTLRWFDIPSLSCVREEVLDGEIKSCEIVELAQGYSSPSDIGGGKPVLAAAAGKSVYFWDGEQFDNKIKDFQLSHGVASVGLDLKGRKFIVGEEPGTWVRVYSWEDGNEIDVLKGHHGPVWSVAFSPDGKLYATGSEDGTIKMWKNCEGDYGLWKTPADRATK
ncbi:WD repeat protein [Grosmannia clavigera kw1407]|uniref:Serine-threonine kinase receptor-associated protein n=1 Tax=Grosmannia clavigera (strain kw1407 / UAMH 11150) TaxID=655863 RepID=F0XB06_GROCL|nr:WD repeat protein [Grosmannia clavigera kw1407]EFX05158.1 WD repeat protein [Grosmannia clavigera kw1407]